MGKLVASLILLLGVLFVINNFTHPGEVLRILANGDWLYILLALILECAWVAAIAAVYYGVFRALGAQRNYGRLIPLAVAANFVNTVAPTAGVSGLAFLVSNARRNRISSARTMVAGALIVVFDYAGFFVFLLLGLWALFRRGGANAVHLSAATILLAVALGLGMLLYQGMRSAQALGLALRWLAEWANRLAWPFVHRKVVSESGAQQFARDAALGLDQIKREPRGLLPPLLYSFVAKSLLITVLVLMFLAFHVPFSPGTIFSSFAIAYLFFIVSPTPGGLGVVEGLLTITITAMFIPVDAAAVIVLSYRVITFWFPFLLGMLSFQLVNLKKPAAAAGA